MHEGRTPISEALLLNTIKLFLETYERMISNRMDRLEQKLEATMAKVIDLEDAQAVLEAKQGELEAAQKDAFKRIDEDFAEIRRLLAEKPTGTITEAQLDPVLARMQSNTGKLQISIDALKAKDPDPNFPPPAPPVVP